jgi:hypothetical protein
MCWNAAISLNTFVFGVLALVFLYVVNTFTKYKSSTFDNKLTYLFLFVVVSMQLAEFFLWKNLKNADRNRAFSAMSVALIALQPFILMLMIPTATLRYGMLAAYAACGLLYCVFKKEPIRFHTFVAKNGHLSWEWLNFKGYEQVFLLVCILGFYGVPMLAIKNRALSLFALSLLFISWFNYLKHNTFGSMWCWSFNLFFMYCIVDALLIKPYYEYNGLC